MFKRQAEEAGLEVVSAVCVTEVCARDLTVGEVALAAELAEGVKSLYGVCCLDGTAVLVATLEF